jgi:F0F1-type ATP synthase gamma subunit
MANLKEIRNRISSVLNDADYISLMKMVMCCKVEKRHKMPLLLCAPYSDKPTTELLQNLSVSKEDASSKFYEQPEVKKHLLYDHIQPWIAGAFNSTSKN